MHFSRVPAKANGTRRYNQPGLAAKNLVLQIRPLRKSDKKRLFIKSAVLHAFLRGAQIRADSLKGSVALNFFDQ